jgi:hypothetical protein
MRRWRTKNRQRYLDGMRASDLKRRLGMTTEQYDAMLAAQDGTCAICGRPETMIHRVGRVPRLAVDHDHKTGVVRGLLCGNCNHGLGKFQDDPARLRAAADYIERHRARAATA